MLLFPSCGWRCCDCLFVNFLLSLLWLSRNSISHIFFILIFGHLLLLCQFFHYFKFRSLWNQNLTKKYIFYSISQCFYSNPPLSSLPLPSFFSSFPYPSSSSPIILYSFIFFPFMSLLLLFFLSLKILQPFFLYISQMQVYVQILPSSRSPSSYNPEAFQNR